LKEIKKKKTEGYTWRPERMTGIAWAWTKVGPSKPNLSVFFLIIYINKFND
jgi:hypothetical protein